MTSISGGKFWSGFASGALSSIASSAWSGGDTITDNGNYTMSITKHAGLGAGTGDLGMIAFGTVSGGAGAALTGGNFWQGAVTGLVVSGLNHAMHKMEDMFAKNRIDKEVDTAYGANADSAAPATDATLVEMKNSLPTLKGIYPKTGYAAIESSKLYSVGSAEAKTFAYDTDNYKKSNIVFYRKAFSSYRNLAHTMLHEFGHAVNFYNMNYFNYRSSHSASASDSWGERQAFKFAFDNGGRAYQNDPWYKANK